MMFLTSAPSPHAGHHGMSAVVSQPPSSSHLNSNINMAYTTSDQAVLIEDQLTSSGGYDGHHRPGDRRPGGRRGSGTRIGSRRGIHKFKEPEIRPWSSSLLSCFQDPEICITGLVCSPCLASRLAERLGENPMVCCLPFGCAALRVKLRTKHYIQGDICSDFGVTCCCVCPLSMCQMWRELDFIEKKPSSDSQGNGGGLARRFLDSLNE